MFQQDQKGFFRTLEEEEAHEGEMSEMGKFVEFGEIFGKEKKERQTCHGWKRQGDN